MPRRKSSCAAFFLGTLLLVGCGGSGGDHPSGTTVFGTGTIRHESVEGGFYAIHADDGQIYDPTNLAPDFSQDGLRISFRAKIRSDLSSTHQVGTIIDLSTIRRIPQ